MLTPLAETGPTRAVSLEVTHLGDGLLTGKIGPVCLAIWRGKPQRATFEIQRASLARAVAVAPGRALFLCVIGAKADPPDDDIRAASAKMLNQHGRALAGCACVIEGTGFRAALTRTVLTGISLIARSSVPTSFVDNVATATAWLQRRSPDTRLTELPALVEAARARLDASA